MNLQSERQEINDLFRHVTKECQLTTKKRCQVGSWRVCKHGKLSRIEIKNLRVISIWDLSPCDCLDSFERELKRPWSRDPFAGPLLRRWTGKSVMISTEGRESKGKGVVKLGRCGVASPVSDFIQCTSWIWSGQRILLKTHTLNCFFYYNSLMKQGIYLGHTLSPWLSCISFSPKLELQFLSSK